MIWDKEYEQNGLVWGEKPSELATVAARYLHDNLLNNKVLQLLDVGCGYGRDALYLSDNTECQILGIDVSEKAVEMARSSTLKARKEDVRFLCCDFSQLNDDKYDIIFISNVYQLLATHERKELRKKVTKKLETKGLLFLSTLSVNDPEHYGKGVPIPNESNSFSFQNRIYLHFCTREELIKDFGFVKIRDLYEHEYYEPRANGERHHHISWILIGENVR